MTFQPPIALRPAAIGTVPVYVLTIDPVDGARRQSAVAQFAAVSQPFRFVQGLTATDPAVRRAYAPVLNLLCARRPLSATEVAVYLGHRKAWQSLLDGPDAVALVCEDDLAITDPAAFRRLMAKAAALRDTPPDWDVLKLFDLRPRRIVAETRWQGFRLVDYKYPSNGCVAYLLTRQGAERLLKRDRLFRPVDEDLTHCWELGLTVRSLVPNIVTEASADLGGSLIEADRRKGKRGRNPLRAVWSVGLQLYKQARARLHHSRRRQQAA